MLGFLGNRGTEGDKGEIQFLNTGAQGKHEHQGIEDRPGEQAVLASSKADGFADPLPDRKALAIGLAQLDAGDESALAGFVDERMRGFERGEAVGEMGDFRLEISEGVFVVKEIETGEGSGAAEWVGGVAVTVIESLVGIAEEGVVNARCGERGSHRHRAAGEAFGEAEEIGDHVFLLAGKQGARATEAGHDFIEDEVDVMRIAPRTQVGEHAFRPGAHFIDALDEWFNDHGGNGFGGELIELCERGDMLDGVAVVFEAIEKAPHATERRSAEGVAVVAVGKGDKAMSLGLTGLHPVLDRHFQGALDGGGAVVGKEYALERILREECAEPLRELDGIRMRETEKRGVGGLFELGGDRGVDGGMGVTVDVGPDR